MAKMLITPKAMAKIFAYAHACSTEISGFASWNQDGVIDSVLPLLKQNCSAAETELDEDMLAEFVSSGQSKRATVHWHSHLLMGCFWSATDEQNIEGLGRFLPVLVSIVVNKKNEYKARIDYFNPLRMHHDLELVQHYILAPHEEAKIQAEVKKNVSTELISIKDMPIISPSTMFSNEYWENYGRYDHTHTRYPGLSPASDSDIRKLVEEEKKRLKSRNGPNSDLFGGE